MNKALSVLGLIISVTVIVFGVLGAYKEMNTHSLNKLKEERRREELLINVSQEKFLYCIKQGDLENKDTFLETIGKCKSMHLK
jgi:hypothetical protein